MTEGVFVAGTNHGFSCNIIGRLAALVLVLAASQPPEAFAQDARFLNLPQTYVTAQKCSFNLIGSEDIPTDISPRLTSGWSQEGVGLPEVRSFLRDEGITLRKVRIGVVDVTIDIDLIRDHLIHPDSSEALPNKSERYAIGHGGLVSMVLAAPQFGMTQNALFSLTDDFGKVHYLEDEVHPVEIMTRSLKVNQRTKGIVSELLKVNQGQMFLLVSSAGNHYVDDFRSTGAFPGIFGDVPALVVSAVTPTGRINRDSGGGPEVTVGAPSYGPGFQHPKHYRQYLDGGWDFSGTSAAAPMVTGALIGVLGLIEGLSFDEVKELLKHTSFSTRDFQGGHSFGGYGVLNYYKLMRVAHRLAQSGWPENRGAIFESGPGSIYDFEEESLEKFNYAEGFVRDNPEGSCEDKLTVLKELRQGFFLDPNHVGIRQAIYALYVNENYHDQALYFSPLGAEFYGGYLSTYRLERELLNTVASGDYDRAVSTIRGGGAEFGQHLTTNAWRALDAVVEIALNRPHDQRGDFLRVVSRLLPEVKRAAVLKILVLEYIYSERKEGLEFIKALLLEEGNFNARDGLGRDALYWAVVEGNFGFVDFLLQAGAKVSQMTFTAAVGYLDAEVHSVSYVQRMGILRALLEKVDVSDRKAYATNALPAAVFEGNPDVLFLLLQSGAEVTAKNLVSAGDLRSFKMLLQYAEGDVNSGDEQGQRPLTNAIVLGLEAVELLLKHGAEVNAEDLLQAARGSSVDILKVLLLHKSEGVNLNAQDSEGRSALSYAVQTGGMEAVELLLELGADVQAEELLQAAGGSVEILKVLLLNKGEDLNVSAQNGQGESALTMAAQSGSWEAVELLLGLGAEVNTTALQAAARGRVDILEAFLKAGADVNAQGEGGRSALTVAARSGSMEAVQLLLKYGARVNAEDVRAAADSDVDILRVFLAVGTSVDVNAQGERRQSALSLAVTSGSVEAVELLLEYGAEVNAEDIRQAAGRGFEEVLRVLLRENRGVHIKSSRGLLSSAGRSRSVEAVELLLEYGAEVDASDIRQAADRGLAEVLRVLLRESRSVNIKSDHGLLHSAVLSGSVEAVELLLRYGIEVDKLALEMAGRPGRAEIAALLHEHLSEGLD